MEIVWKVLSPPPPPPPRFGGAESRTDGKGQRVLEIHLATLSLVCSPKIAVGKGWGEICERDGHTVQQLSQLRLTAD